jgi:2-keto-4-pentenoate hydratase/2-oxohepta-3-ene-1,7-dioic acid hydratase in catechol pathway
MAPITPGNAVVANGANILLPSEAPDFVDYEGELAVIIGRRCHEVDEKDASKYVLGVTACIDLSMRDEQFRGLLSIRAGNKDVNLGDAKKFNGSKPLGPEILLLDDGDVSALDLELTTHVNGELRQSGRTTELLFSISRLIAEASAKSPLEPGDIISTGTPAGVGMARGVFLEKGDRVDVRLGGMEPLSVTFV